MKQELIRFFQNQAELNGASYTAGTNSVNFALTPTVLQKLLDRVMQSSAFLSKVNHQSVTLQGGRALGLGIGKPIASRTNTADGTKKRTPKKVHEMTELYDYLCVQTNFDTMITYAELDAWRELPDFEQRIVNRIISQIALDTLMIGWNGTKVSADTDLTANPLLQDVNKGWLQKIRDAGGTHFRSGVTVGAGAGANYKNIDELVDNFINTYIHEAYQEREDLVVIPARNLVNHKYTGIWNAAGANTELIAAGQLDRDKYHFANRAIERTSFMPAGTLLVTPVNNLSIYTQKDSSRRTFKDVPEGDRLEAFQSQNVAYVVEDYDACVLVENITFV